MWHNWLFAAFMQHGLCLFYWEKIFIRKIILTALKIYSAMVYKQKFASGCKMLVTFPTCVGANESWKNVDENKRAHITRKYIQNKSRGWHETNNILTPELLNSGLLICDQSHSRSEWNWNSSQCFLWTLGKHQRYKWERNEEEISHLALNWFDAHMKRLFITEELANCKSVHIKAWRKITLHTETKTPFCEALLQGKKGVIIALSVSEAGTWGQMEALE